MAPSSMRYQLSKAYLQWARAIVGAKIRCTEQDGLRYPPNLMLAVMSHVYIYSHMAIVAFANGQVGVLWGQKNPYLRKKFQHHADIAGLLRQDLGELKVCLRELCQAMSIEDISVAEPRVWNDLNQVLKQSRDFLVHPTKDPALFQSAMDRMIKKHFAFPIQVAEKTITYFYAKTHSKVPKWLSDAFFGPSRSPSRSMPITVSDQADHHLGACRSPFRPCRSA